MSGRDENLTPFTRVPYGPQRPSKILLGLAIVFGAGLIAAFAFFVYKLWIVPDYEGVVRSAGSSWILIEADDGGMGCQGETVFAPTTDATVKRDGDKIEWQDIQVGDHVRVWTTGGGDDSCPPEKGARRIEVD